MVRKEVFMYWYRIYGLNVESDIRISEAQICEKAVSVDVKIQASDLSNIVTEIKGVMSSNVVKGHEEETASLVRRLGGAESILYYLDIGIFKVVEGKRIEYMAEMDTDTPVFRQWLLCMAFGVIMIQRQQIMLHGSCLMHKNKDAAFILSGDSGSGKSTLANALLNRGCRFKADDAVALDILDNEKIEAYGAFPARRLCKDIVEKENIDKSKLQYIEDGGREKYILDMSDAYFGEPHCLEKIFILKPGEYEKVECVELNGSAKLNSIIYNLYKRDTYKEIGITPDIFKKCVQIAQNIKVYELHRPTMQDTVEELTNVVIVNFLDN